MNDAKVTKKCRGGIGLDRALKLQGQAKSKIQDIFSSAKSFLFTSEKITEQRNVVTVWLQEKRAPYWVHAYIRGYYEALRDQLWRSNLTWTMSVDGQLLTSQEIKELNAEEMARGQDKVEGYTSPWGRVDSDLSRHVWIDNDGVVRKDKSFDAKWR